MTPLFPQLLLPTVVVAGAGMIVWKLSWREYPALITWMCFAVFSQAVTFGGVPYPHWLMLLQDAIACAVTAEVIWVSRLRVATEIRARAIGLAFAGAAVLASAPVGLTDIQRAYLFRSYFLLAPAAALVGISFYRAARPVLECSRHVVYRLGAASWLLLMAVSGSFVRGGLGYRIFPYTAQTWKLVSLAAYWTLILIVGAMSLGIAWSIPRRKRAAKAMQPTLPGPVVMRKTA